VEKSLLTVSEAAQVLSIGRTKTYELMSAGDLPVVRIGRAVRIPRRALERWVDEQEELSAGHGAR
jgi:excisionase family DNA binding protein